MFSKNFTKLEAIYNKPYFFTEEIAELLDISIESARVFVTRYSKQGIFVKLRKNCYCFKAKWNVNSEEDFFNISCILRVPSYVSLLSALSYYGVSTQMLQDMFENITILSTKEYQIEKKVFKYYKVKKNIFFGFVRKNGYFIAEKEKAFLDAVYLQSFGKYSIDLSAIELEKLDIEKVSMLAKHYPKKTINAVRKICRI